MLCRCYRERTQHWSDAEWEMWRQQKHLARVCRGVRSVFKQRPRHWSDGVLLVSQIITSFLSITGCLRFSLTSQSKKDFYSTVWAIVGGRRETVFSLLTQDELGLFTVVRNQTVGVLTQIAFAARVNENWGTFEVHKPWRRNQRYCHKVMPNSCKCATSTE